MTTASTTSGAASTETLRRCDYNPNIGGAAPLPSQTHFAIFGYSQSAVVASLVKNGTDRSTNLDGRSLDGTEFY